MEEKTVVVKEPGILFVVLLIPALAAGIYIGILRGWLIGLIVTAVLSANNVWTFRSVWLRKEVDPSLKEELQSKFLTLINAVMETVLAVITVGAIYLLFQSPEFIDFLESRNTKSIISMACMYVTLFVIYVFLRWAIIKRTTGWSVALVAAISAVTVFAIIWTFAFGYTENGIVDTTIKEITIEGEESNRVFKFTLDELNSTDPNIKEKLDKAEKSFLYFSVVTFTTLGYGDFQPTKKSRVLASAEAMLGLVFMAFLVAVFFRLLQEHAQEAKSRATAPSLLDALRIIGWFVVYALVMVYLVGNLPG